MRVWVYNWYLVEVCGRRGFASKATTYDVTEQVEGCEGLFVVVAAHVVVTREGLDSQMNGVLE